MFIFFDKKNNKTENKNLSFIAEHTDINVKEVELNKTKNMLQ